MADEIWSQTFGAVIGWFSAPSASVSCSLMWPVIAQVLPLQPLAKQ